MNILNISTLRLNDSHNYFGGAVGNIGYNLLDALARQDDVTVVSSIEDADLLGQAHEDLHLHVVDGLRGLRRFLEDWGWWADVVTHLYFHEPEYQFLADRPARWGVPFVIGMCEAPHVRFSDELSGLGRVWPVRALGKAVASVPHRWTLEQADSVIAVTDHARRYYEGHADGIEVVPYGVDSKLFRPGDAETGRLLTVSRLIERRGIQHMIRALPRLDADYHVVGEGPYLTELRNLAYRLGVLDRVTFHGRVDANELVRQYQLASVYVHLSCSDGWNQTALEAMACGTPVVASDLGHNPMVRDGITGYRVSYSDPKEIADAAGDILVGMAGSMGMAARSVVEQEYDWDAVASRYIDILGGTT